MSSRDLDHATPAPMTLEEANEMLPELEAEEVGSNDIFTLTSLFDSSAAQAAAERLYASSQNGLRFFSELNRALPRSQAERMPRETEVLEDTLEPGLY